jgi:hypothetical protein
MAEMAERTTRVLLTLECDRLDADAMKAVVRLAGDGELEMLGLFVEDEDLLRAARLPGLTEVSVNTGEVTSISADQIREQIAGQARRAQMEFESSARGLKIKHSFRIARGRAVEAVAEAALTSDIVVVSRALRATGLRSRRGVHFEALVQQNRNILFVNEPWASGASVIVLCESTPSECERPLNVARRIADAENIELVLALPPGAQEVQSSPADRVVHLDAWSEDAVAALCDQEDARLLVLPPTERLDWRALLMNIVDRVPCSLLRLD